MSKNKLSAAIKNSDYLLLEGYKIAYLDRIYRLVVVKVYDRLKLI